MDVPPWFQPLRRTIRLNNTPTFNDYRSLERFLSQEEKLWFCGVQNGDIKCEDTVIRKADFERPAKGIQAKKTIKVSDRTWYSQWNIPKRTFEGWMAIHLDPDRGFRNGPGNPSKLDLEARETYQKKVRDLQFGTDGTGPKLPKTNTVRQLLLEGAKETLERTGMKVQGSETLRMSNSTEQSYRSELSSHVKCKDLTDARFKALSDMHHMFQSVAMITAFSGHLNSHEKANFDMTTYEMNRNQNGQVILKLIIINFNQNQN